MVSFPVRRDDHYDLGFRTVVIGFTASLLCIPFAFGCVSAFQFGTIDSSSRSLVREIEVVRLLGTMKQLTQELRALDHLAHAASTDRARHDEAARTAQAHDAFTRAWSAYAPTVRTADERKRAQGLWEAWQHFLTAEAEAAAFDRAGERDLAETVLMTVSQADAAAFTQAADAVLSDHEAGITALIDAVDAAGTTYRLALAIGSWGAALAALGLMRLALRRVAHPMTALASALQRLAETTSRFRSLRRRVPPNSASWRPRREPFRRPCGTRRGATRRLLGCKVRARSAASWSKKRPCGSRARSPASSRP